MQINIHLDAYKDTVNKDTHHKGVTVIVSGMKCDYEDITLLPTLVFGDVLRDSVSVRDSLTT